MSTWKNKKKHGAKNFISSYERDKKGERIFVLTHIKNGKQRRITFESWQAAKALGWKK
jgi:hypothetical protein